MKNPLRSEAEAYRFLLGTIVYFGAIVLAAVVGGTWWGVGVFAVPQRPGAHLVLPARRRCRRRRRPGRASRAPRTRQRILVVANETVGGQKLRDMIRERVRGRSRGSARRLAGA